MINHCIYSIYTLIYTMSTVKCISYSLNVFLISSQKVFFRYELEISLAQKAEYVHDVVGYLSARREYLWQTKRRIDGI